MAAALSMKPDIIVRTKNQTLLFEPQSERVAEWLRRRYLLTGDTATGKTEFLVHPSRRQEITEELKAVGFEVAT